MKVIILITFTLLCSARAQVDVYILAGQSNMIGFPPGGQSPSPVNAQRIWMFNGESWGTARNPVDSCAAHFPGTTPGVGPGVSFADRMATLEPNRNIGIVQCAVSSSHMAPSIAIPWQWHWGPSYSSESLYGNMIMMARKAIAAGGVIKGVLWYQGESETNNRDDIVFYDTRLYQLFGAIRQDLGFDLPIVFVKLGPHVPAPNYEVFWHDLQVLQQEIADTHPAGIAMVDAGDLTLRDIHHIDEPSQVTLGVRLANAMFQLQNP